MDFREAVDYLYSFTDMERGYQASSSPSMNVASVHSLLSRLNDPHLGRKTVHITGSKGKGSTAAMVAEILQFAGNRTSTFSSPHLHSITERIAIDRVPVGPAEFAAAVDAIRPAVEDERESVHGNVSTFGVLTALFFWLTRSQLPRIDWQVVEVGLGGTFDATNVFDRPDVVVITPISLEHTQILGDTTEAIARDKSGIIKKGSTCVLAPQQDPAVIEIVRRRCDEVGAGLLDVGARYDADVIEKHIFGQAFAVHGPWGTRELRTPMLGRHQVDNAVTAAAVADALRARGEDISEAAIAQGIGHARVRGRLEVMGRSPLVVADGAHNGESARALAAALRDYFEWRRCYVFLGVTTDKDLRGIGLALAPLAEQILCCAFGSPRSRDPLDMVREVGLLAPAVSAESVPAAIEAALSHAGSNDLVCITGSLYVVAEAREVLLGDAATLP